MKYLSSIIFSALFLLSSCNSPSGEVALEVVESKGIADEKSGIIANKVIEAMGGESKWGNLEAVSWTFFGARKLLWDKKHNKVRIENPKDTSLVVLDMNTMEGRYSKNGVEETDSILLNKQLKRAKSIWINDSYWLVMPFKLRDPGVNLSHKRVDTLINGSLADVLELTFENVGDTPDNKYEVYVDQTDNLIKQWDFYAKASQEKPSRSWPWDNYKSYDGLLLSAERSDASGPSKVKVYKNIDQSIFENLNSFDYSNDK